MSKFIDLCGAWKLSCNDSPIGKIECEGQVPGCVHTDLIDNKIINNIFYRDNAKQIQWIENCDFSYSKTFDVDHVEDCAYIEFDGLDTYADIFLNNVKIGNVDNMFIPHSFCVDGILQKGKNTLEVRFFSPIKRVENMPIRDGAFTLERMNTRRIQCTYGWDWVERFVTMGIYKGVRLTFRKANEIDNVYIYTDEITKNCAKVKIQVNIRDFKSFCETCNIKIIAPTGEIIYEKEHDILNDCINETVEILTPKLWYPVGYGEQPLYTFIVSTPSSNWTEKFGIREIKVEQIADPENSEYSKISKQLQKESHLKNLDFNKTTTGYIVTVNDVKIMCKGGNWVPCEPFPSAETPNKITQILETAVLGGVNMIRVWGGGIFEQDEFYSECDRLGILVTQDFLMACGEYPEKEKWFIDALNSEAKTAALRLRNHACLAYWCGDNENALKGSDHRTDFRGYISAKFGIEPILLKLDPHRQFFPSSPYGGDYYASSTCGTSHVTAYLGDMFDYILNTDMKEYRQAFSKYYSRFCSEYPSFGMSFVSSLKKYMDNSDIFNDKSMEILEYHSKNNPSLEISLFTTYSVAAQKIFGEYSSGEDAILKYQMLHCELIRLSMELYRRYKGYSWGIIYWMLNDCWPASAGWSLIDYYTCPKPAYYAFKRSSKPVIATISSENDKLSLFICNDSLNKACGRARLYVHDVKTNTDVYSTTISFETNENCTEKIFECDFSCVEDKLTNSTVILCDISSNLGEDRALFVKERFVDLDLSFTKPIVVSQTETEITVTTNSFNPFVMLDVPYLLSDNCFTLKANETKTIKILKKL